MDVHAIGLQVDDWIPNNLSGTVVGDVAAAPRLVDLDAARREHRGVRTQVLPPSIGADSERDDVWMLEEQERVVDSTFLPVFDERLLKR
jgi:hypothetical protein